ncbi:MAG: thiamine-phosphate kinase [Thermoguttaceae bacterium]|jgi:thiamine-monophosphate kinase|nr:thiamine-phosphate kinase [Thermoguttaceae bacterium]
MESALIAELRRRIGPHPLVRLGLGDDAAVLRMAAVDECAVTVDMLMDGVDFHLRDADPRRVGRKALAANLSDLAAMATRPLAGVVALALPRAGAMDLAVALYDGMLPLAAKYGLAIAGGDTNSWDGPLAVSITLFGAVTSRGPLTRRGARPGDRIVVTGAFGGSILGRHFDFEPRVDEALILAERYTLHAGIDVSDGLSIDLGRLCQESSCGAEVEVQRIPIHDDAHRLAERLADGSTPLDHALADGEDFELVLAVPPDEADRMLAEQPLAVPLTVIGRFVDRPGLWRVEGGIAVPLAARGYEHHFT